MIAIGVTGGIGSGKSTVAGLLASRGAAVIDADQIARQVTAPGGASYDAVRERFGPAVVNQDGTLDRAAIATRVFADPAELAALNGITHPAIALELARRLADHAGTDDVVVLDIPLLSEPMRSLYGLAGVIVVDAPVEVALGRLVDQRGLTEADARGRVAAQVSREERRRMADVVIDNGGSRQDLAASIDSLWAWIQSRGSIDGPTQEPHDTDAAEGGEEHQ